MDGVGNKILASSMPAAQTVYAKFSREAIDKAHDEFEGSRRRVFWRIKQHISEATTEALGQPWWTKPDPIPPQFRLP